MHDIGLENLRFGIVEQAVDDYFSLLAGFITPTTDCNIVELERFFYSDWFSVLCKLEPDYIIAVSYTHLDVYKRQGLT